MKRTHTEQVEYFEHGGDRYRRFADGTWQVQVSNGWSERFCDSKQLEAAFNQIEDCGVCKYYKENPHFHCAVHPNGPDGACSDWEIKTVSTESWESIDYFLNNQSRDLPVVSVYHLAFYIGQIDETIYSGEVERCAWGMDGYSLTETLYTGITKGHIMQEPYKHSMSDHFASIMNTIWNINSKKRDTAVIKDGRIERITRNDKQIWQYPDVN